MGINITTNKYDIIIFTEIKLKEEEQMMLKGYETNSITRKIGKKAAEGVAIITEKGSPKDGNISIGYKKHRSGCK